jgi:hypothetical protein
MYYVRFCLDDLPVLDENPAFDSNDFISLKLSYSSQLTQLGNVDSRMAPEFA